jgi:hypothetical protein
MALTVRELTTDDYPLWDALTRVSPQRAIYTERWWMEITTGGGYRLLGCFQGERLLGGLPIWPTVTLGVSRLRQPPLTPYWGPLLAPTEGKPLNQRNQEMHILRALADALAPWPDVTMQFHPSLTNWLPFYWNGFTQLTRYTYRIADMTDLTRVQQACDSSVGQQVRRAQRDGLRVVDDVDPRVVCDLNQQSMQRRQRQGSDEIPHFWPALARAAQERHCLFTTAAMDAEDNLHSAQAIVWDDRCAYGLYNGSDARFRQAYGGTLTLWRALERAGTVAPEFDFEGSTVESVEQFYRRFGGQLTPYFLVTRAASARLNTARGLQRALQRGKSLLGRR